MLKLIFWASFLLLFYTYVGYYILLWILIRIVRFKDNLQYKYEHENFFPSITIIVAVYNEQEVISKRIKNLLQIDYPKEMMEIIIASDGSTDGTVEKAKRFANQGVKVLDFKENRGKASVHNDSISVAKGEIIVLTDADSEFKKDFVKKIVLPFSDPKVGCAVGNLVYRSHGSYVADAESLYYNKLELRLKDLENKLGILANGTGACMAIRKKLFKPLTPVDDTDTATVIDIILQGYRVVFVKDAIAYDIPPHSLRSELQVKIRGVSKTLMSISRRMNLKEWYKHPFLIWNLLSHRIFRYLTPYFMVAAFILNLCLLKEGLLYQIIFITQIAFYSLIVLGLVGECFRKGIPIASVAFSFSVALLGMMVGVAVAIMGKAPTSHKTDDGI